MTTDSCIGQHNNDTKQTKESQQLKCIKGDHNIIANAFNHFDRKDKKATMFILAPKDEVYAQLFGLEKLPVDIFCLKCEVDCKGTRYQ